MTEVYFSYSTTVAHRGTACVESLARNLQGFFPQKSNAMIQNILDSNRSHMLVLINVLHSNKLLTVASLNCC